MEYLGLLLSIGIAIYLFVQAPKFGKNKWLWAIFGFIFGLITLGIFFIKTNRKVLGWILVIFSVILYIFYILMMLAILAFAWTNI